MQKWRSMEHIIFYSEPGKGLLLREDICHWSPYCINITAEKIVLE